MPTASEYRANVMALDRPGLLSLWEDLQASNTPEWGPGMAMEYLVIRAFDLEGATVEWPYHVREDDDELEQVDGAVFAAGLHCLVETKTTVRPVNPDVLMKVQWRLRCRPAQTIGAVFSLYGFTDTVFLDRHLTRGLLLWGKEEFGMCLRTGRMIAGLEKKHRYAISFGMPDADLRA